MSPLNHAGRQFPPIVDRPAARCRSKRGFMSDLIDTAALQPSQLRWSHFEHGADIGISGEGATLAETFAAVATALTAIVTDPAAVKDDAAVAISCEAPSPQLLLVDFLNAIIFQMATNDLLFRRYRVETDGVNLRATAWGERVDLVRHAPAVEPKGATYTALTVEHRADGRWRAACVIDV